MLALRCALFYFLYNATGFWYGLSGAMIGWMPYHRRSGYIRTWNFCAVFFAQKLVGIRINLIGKDNIPDTPCIIMSKHQSQLETFYLQTLFTSLCTILKKELLRIPFFGQGLKNLEPIAIDRSKPRQALKEIQSEGLKRLSQGRKILIFPEGTRTPYGVKGSYARSGANLAIGGDVPILPVAHNFGLCWPAGKFLKKPGTITMSLGPLISSAGKTSKQLTSEVEAWIEAECERLGDGTH